MPVGNRYLSPKPEFSSLQRFLPEFGPAIRARKPSFYVYYFVRLVFFLTRYAYTREANIREPRECVLPKAKYWRDQGTEIGYYFTDHEIEIARRCWHARKHTRWACCCTLFLLSGPASIISRVSLFLSFVFILKHYLPKPPALTSCERKLHSKDNELQREAETYNGI